MLGEEYFRATSYTIKTQVVDSVSNEPVAFASVYLKHRNDTLITSFNLTDTLGKAELKEVVRGDYNLFVEYMGYKPYVKPYYISSDRELPVIRLQLDNRLKEARVSAVGQAIEFKQDTIIYNASSFRSLAGENLADLLRKMPGIEVADDGGVKVNGKSVSKITVNGKTFFMGDNKAALDNLPASYVNKVKVTDKETDEAQFTGITTGERETVMDVDLKEEYKKGFFGNVKVAGGTSVKGSSDNEFLAYKPLLLDGSTMISAYGEKNQFTAIANARNVMADDVFGYIVAYGGGDNLSLGTGGVRRGGSAGGNLNSEALKGMKTNASVMFSTESVDRHKRTDRITFMDESEDLWDNSENTSAGSLDHLNFKFEVENKKQDKFWLRFAPRFHYKKHDENSLETSTGKMGNEVRNESEAISSSSMEQLDASGYLNLGVRKLGKARRTLSWGGNYTIQSTYGDALDVSNTWFAGSDIPLERNLRYDKDNYYNSISSTLNYVEPIGKSWAMSTSLNASYSEHNRQSDAFNKDGSANDYFTSVSNNHYTSLMGNLLAQYSKGKTTLQFGTVLRTIENKTYSKVYGLDTETGAGEWQNNISPYLRFNTKVRDINYRLNLSSYSSQPASSQLAPTFSIVNPTRLSMGNIYMKPSFTTSADFSARGNWDGTSVSLYFNGRYTDNAPVSATWFDNNSVRYSIPVNSLKPQYTYDVDLNISVPLNKERTVTISYSPDISVNRSTSYQAGGILPGVELDGFKYSDFMKDFWGNAAGNRFYSGQSGFRESVTRDMKYGHYFTFGLNFERFSLSSYASFRKNKSTYSLDPKANTSTFVNSFGITPQYTAPYDITFKMNLNYENRGGYGEGYDNTLFDIDLNIVKSFKALSVGLKCVDILDDSVSFGRTVTENYRQDSYFMTLGRRVLFQLTYNFGKMNAAQSSKARSAAVNMSW